MSGKGDKRIPGKGYGDGYDRIYGDPNVEADPITAVLDACAEQNAKEETYYICADCLEEVTQVRSGDESLDYCGECGNIVEGNTLTCVREKQK